MICTCIHLTHCHRSIIAVIAVVTVDTQVTCFILNMLLTYELSLSIYPNPLTILEDIGDPDTLNDNVCAYIHIVLSQFRVFEIKYCTFVG